MYLPEIFCIEGLVLSVCMHVMAFQDQHTAKYSLSAGITNKQLDRIFDCEEGVLVLECHYMHTNRENKAFDTKYFWQIHRYEQREREKTVDFMTFSVNWKTKLVFLPKLVRYDSLTKYR